MKRVGEREGENQGNGKCTNFQYSAKMYCAPTKRILPSFLNYFKFPRFSLEGLLPNGSVQRYNVTDPERVPS